MSLVQFRPEAYADLAHLVERNLAKVEVAGPSPVIRLETVMVTSRLVSFVYSVRRLFFGLRADACGFGILQILRSFVLPDGTQEDPRAGPSCESPGPTAGEERLPRLWIPPLPPQVQPPF